MELLFVSANSRNNYIDIEREQRSLQTLFDGNGHSLKVLPAAEVDDLQTALKMRGRPCGFDVLHFSGHATRKEGLHLRGSGRQTAFLSCDALKVMLQGSGIRLAVLNACESHELALALSEVVPAAIGTTRPVRDVAARKFTRDFYFALQKEGAVRTALTYAVARQKPASTPGYSCVGEEVFL